MDGAERKEHCSHAISTLRVVLARLLADETGDVRDGLRFFAEEQGGPNVVRERCRSDRRIDAIRTNEWFLSAFEDELALEACGDAALDPLIEDLPGVQAKNPLLGGSTPS